MKNKSNSRGFAPIISLVFVAALALAVPLTVGLAQKVQTIRSYASDASKSGDAAWAQAKLAGKSDDEARKAAENSYNNTAAAKPPSQEEKQRDAAVDQAKQQAIQQAGDSSKVNPNTIKQIEQANGVNPAATPAIPSATTTDAAAIERQRILDQQPIIVYYCNFDIFCIAEKNGQVAAGYNMTTDGTLTKVTITTSVSTSPDSMTFGVACPNGICPPTVISSGTECTGSQTKCAIGLEYSCENGYWGSGHRCSGGGYCTGTSCPNSALVGTSARTDPYQTAPVGCTTSQTSCLDQNTEIYCVDGKYNTTRSCSGGEKCNGGSCKSISEINAPVGISAAPPTPAGAGITAAAPAGNYPANNDLNARVNQSASTLLSSIPTIPLPQVSLDKGYYHTLQGNGQVTTGQNYVPLLQPNTVTNGTSYQTMVIQSQDGYKTNVGYKETKNINSGDKVLTNSATYVVEKSGELQKTPQKLPIPTPGQVDQGSLGANILAKAGDAIFDAIFGRFVK